MNERLTAIVSGRVQGVMYRDFAQRKGSGLSLVGSVRNRPDGTVEVIAEGPRERLELYVERLKKGSLFSKVEEVRPTFVPATGEFVDFVISYE
ncbi:MAG: acylphosphatase [Candidatus Pacebacteria bacterium]|nr:acylphosphatase [Candidatus Paceibacterota bacterium]